MSADRGFTYKRGATWWIGYSVQGKRYMESAKSSVKGDAIKLLDKRRGELGLGTFNPDAEKLTFSDLAALLEGDYRQNEHKSLGRALRAVKALRDYFGPMPALLIPARVDGYITKRLGEGLKPATVQRELSALKRMFTLAYQRRILTQRPYIPSLRVRNTRQGFFEDDELKRVLLNLKPHLRAVVEFAYLTGWRKGEILGLEWWQVDFKEQTIRLEPGSTKNDEGRVLPFSKFPTLAALLEAQRDHTRALERATATIIPTVFHRAGRPILDFREAWETACDKAKVSGRLFHDLRRTAVRNLERAGVPRSVAMRITGHLTESIYKRYAIVCEADLADAGEKLEQAAQERATASRTR